jgi:hypothetical protein
MLQETVWLAPCLPSVVYVEATRNLVGPILNLRRIVFFVSLPLAIIATAAVDVRAQNSTAHLVGQPIFEDLVIETVLKTTAGPAPAASIAMQSTVVATLATTIALAPLPVVEPLAVEPIVAKAPILQTASTKGTALAQGSMIIRGSGAAGVPPREALAESVQAALTSNPEVQIAKAREDDARYGVSEARAAYLPRVDLSASTGPEYNVPDGQNGVYKRRGEASITTKQLLWDFGLTLNDIRRARKI